MSSVKCVHCGTENDPAKTAGYCDDCGKKLPGIYTPQRSSFSPNQESDTAETRPGKGSQGGIGFPHTAVYAIVGFFAAALTGIALLFFGVQGARGVGCLVTFIGLGLVGLIVALRGAFASREQLLHMSDWIGTKNPTAARIVCWLFLVVIFGLACLAGYMAISPEFRRWIGFAG